MLAQNFLSPTDLGITAKEQTALIAVLGMLERGELKHQPDSDVEGDKLFNMNNCGSGCGTPACIGGWAALLMGVDQYRYVNEGYGDRTEELRDLYWNDHGTDEKTTPVQAAIALRSYLTTGKANWDEALA